MKKTMVIILFNNLYLLKEYFEYEDDKKIDLSSEEKALYGNREPKGYSKIKLIGKYDSI